MKAKMRYTLHCSIIFLCFFIIFIQTPMTTHALPSTRSNTLIDKSRYDLAGDLPFERKRSFTCDSCGNECTNACGTKNFRTCCFNYLRKRNDPNIMKSISNQHLIDFILLQGRAAMYTLAERNRNDDERDESDDDDVSIIGMFGDGKKLQGVGNEVRLDRENIRHTIV